MIGTIFNAGVNATLTDSLTWESDDDLLEEFLNDTYDSSKVGPAIPVSFLVIEAARVLKLDYKLAEDNETDDDADIVH